MYVLLVALVLGLFGALLFVNLYFRARVLKSYRVLVKHQVEFDARHVFNPEKMEAEIIPRHPEVAGDIRAFCGFLRRSIRMASALVALITLFGAILMYYR